MADFRAEIRAILDLSEANRQYNDFVSRLKTPINLDVNVNSNTGAFTNFVNSFQRQGQNAGQQFAQSFTSSLNKIGGGRWNSGRMKEMLQTAGFDSNSINNVTKQLNNMLLTVDKIRTTQLSNGNIRMSISGVDDLQRAVTIVRDFDHVTGEIINSSKSFTQNFSESFREIKVASSEALNTAANNLTTWANKNSEAVKGFEDRINDLRSEMSNMLLHGASREDLNTWNDMFRELQSDVKAASSEFELLANKQEMVIAKNNLTSWANKNSEAVNGFESRVEALNTEMENMLANGATTTQFREWSRSFKTLQSEVKATASNFNELHAQMLDNQITAWARNNSKAAKEYGDRLDELHTKLQNAIGAKDLQAFKQVRDEFRLLQSEAKATGNVGKTMGDKFKAAFTSMSSFFMSYVSIRQIFVEIKKGITTIVELDDALVDLKKTTTASAKELNDFYYEANEIAKQYGATTQQIIQGTADWSRLGYSINDAKTMSKLSSQFASISPGMTVSEATEDLVSTMKAFGIEADDVLDGIMSKVNKVGNSFALSNTDIMEALKNSSSAMAVANNTLDETIALITAGNEIVQDASKVGNGLRTGFCAYVQKCA